MPKKKVEEIFDKYAKGYSTGEFAPCLYEHVARTAMSFADDITWHYLQKYTPIDKNSYILDAGGGDGYWAQKFIELGYSEIVIADISQGMLDQARERLNKLSHKHNTQFIKADITDMREFRSNTFDYLFSQYDAVSLCMDPQKALLEFGRISKQGAYVVVSLDTKFRRVPEFIEAKQLEAVRRLLKTNVSVEFGFPQYNLRWEELSDYYEMAGLEVVETVGTPVFMHQVSESVMKELEQDPEVRKELLAIEMEYCTDKSLINNAGHLQMIGRKK
ncbi:MAG: methyltransferase domain-containing protein [Candidatus Heimdallarchaeota archaeon]|nr:MAG: methyltransferase domain-containing protein [Candidatus Heimdallarchaeota archaeon]